MNFKDQMTEDMKNVFLNENEFAIPMTIDGLACLGIVEKNAGGYDEGVFTLIISSTTSISESSSVVVYGKSYSVLSYEDDLFGERKVILGGVL